MLYWEVVSLQFGGGNLTSPVCWVAVTCFAQNLQLKTVWRLLLHAVLYPGQYLPLEGFLHGCHHLQLLMNDLELKLQMLIFSLKVLEDLRSLVCVRRLTAF